MLARSCASQSRVDGATRLRVAPWLWAQAPRIEQESDLLIIPSQTCACRHRCSVCHQHVCHKAGAQLRLLQSDCVTVDITSRCRADVTAQRQRHVSNATRSIAHIRVGHCSHDLCILQAVHCMQCDSRTMLLNALYLPRARPLDHDACLCVLSGTYHMPQCSACAGAAASTLPTDWLITLQSCMLLCTASCDSRLAQRC